MLRQESAQGEVGVGDGQRAALAVADRAWMGARRLRAHRIEPGTEGQNGAATCRHRVDIQLKTHTERERE